MSVVQPAGKKFSKVQWAILFSLTTFILVVLIALIGLIGLDAFLPQIVSAADSLGVGAVGASSSTPTVTATGLVVAQVSSTTTATPFRPLPTSTPTPTPTPTITPSPTPTQTETPSQSPTPWPPDSALISDIYGYAQIYNLDCEARAAVDWARYFGVEINENEFLDALPGSDDPNLGFVGSVMGPPGLIPPYSYGVYAAPIMDVLRSYGLPAEDKYGITMDELKQQIAAGNPVIIWIIFGVTPGYPIDYTTQAGKTVVVAYNEHAAILIGYDPNGVTVLDEGTTYWRSWSAFEQSFSVLGNMAIVYQPDN